MTRSDPMNVTRKNFKVKTTLFQNCFFAIDHYFINIYQYSHVKYRFSSAVRLVGESEIWMWKRRLFHVDPANVLTFNCICKYTLNRARTNHIIQYQLWLDREPVAVLFSFKRHDVTIHFSSMKTCLFIFYMYVLQFKGHTQLIIIL